MLAIIKLHIPAYPIAYIPHESGQYETASLALLNRYQHYQLLLLGGGVVLFFVKNKTV